MVLHLQLKSLRPWRRIVTYSEYAYCSYVDKWWMQARTVEQERSKCFWCEVVTEITVEEERNIRGRSFKSTWHLLYSGLGEDKQLV